MRSWMGCLVLGALGASGGCVAPDGFGFDFGGPFPVFGETTTSKELTFTLDDLHPVQRFVVRLTVAPTSFDAHVDAAVRRADAGFRLELVDEQFASDVPQNWPGADVGFVFRAASSGNADDRKQLSIAREAADAGLSVSVDIDLSLAAPTDVDFDGIEDDVLVELSPLEPVLE